MAHSTYRIRIVKPEFELEAEGDKAFVMDMIRRLEGNVPAFAMDVKSRGRQLTNKTSTERKLISAGEFIRQVGAKKHTDTVLAFGYYLEKYAGLKQFTAADINRCYSDAKMKNSNTSQIIINNIRTRRIVEVKKKGEKGPKAYVLTRTGVEYIEKRLKNSEK
ncbi:MAG: hypothetical protein DRG63_11670 [Deltaproteobacteria bacterium]|nr:MAG: hypothetical protein DRG63_11670 [Deltaproteobacteria bacterium]